MSQQAVSDFVQKVEKDSALRGKLSQLAREDMAGILKVASTAGFNFTADEYTAYWQTSGRGNIAQNLPESLSEEELDKVAGGQKPTSLTCCLAKTTRHDWGY